MSDANMVLDFAREIGQTRPLTELAGGVADIVQGSRTKKAYEGAFEAYRESPNQDTLAKLYEVGIPLGYGADISRMAAGAVVAPGADVPISYQQQYQAQLDLFEEEPTDENEVPLLQLAELTGSYEQTQDYINIFRRRVQQEEQQKAEADFQAAVEAQTANPESVEATVAVWNAARAAGVDPTDQAALQAATQAARARSAQTAVATTWGAFQEDVLSEDKRKAFYAAALETGQLTELMGAVSEMTNVEKTQQAEEFIRVISSLMSGNTEAGVSALNEAISAAEADGDTEKAEQLKRYKERIESGETDAVVTELTALTGLLGDDANAGLDRLRENREEQRNTLLDAANILSITNRAEYATEEDKLFARQNIDGLFGRQGQALVDMVNVAAGVEEGTLSNQELLDEEHRLRAELDRNTDVYRTITDAYSNIILVNGVADISGMSDQALITLYALLLDPNSSVREGEANRLAAAQGIFDTIDTLPDRIAKGVVLSENARNAIIDTATRLNDFALAQIDTFNSRAQQTVDFVDPEGARGTRDRIFKGDPAVDVAPPSEALRTVRSSPLYQGATTAQRRAINNMSEQELQRNFRTVLSSAGGTSAGGVIDLGGDR